MPHGTDQSGGGNLTILGEAMSAGPSNSTQCPYCGVRCRTVKTRQVTDVYREITYLCTSEECAAMFVAALTPVRSLNESSLPGRRRVGVPFAVGVSPNQMQFPFL